MKDTYYFSHDYNARGDEKILKLRIGEGWKGYGIYWAIIEKLYEANGYLDKDYTTIAFDLQTDEETVHKVVENYVLFEEKNGKFYSKSVLRRLKNKKEKSDKAKQSAKSRWNKPNNDYANALPTQSDSNAIKERKGKEIIYSKNNPKKSVYKDFDQFELHDGTIAIMNWDKWVDKNNTSININRDGYPECPPNNK